MTFGQALEALRQGKLVARSCWVLRVVRAYRPEELDALLIDPEMRLRRQLLRGPEFILGTFLQQSRRKLPIIAWSPSDVDLFAEDWVILEEPKANARTRS